MKIVLAGSLSVRFTSILIILIGFLFDIPLDSSPCAAAQNCDDESLDATGADASTNFPEILLGRVVLTYRSFILDPSLWHCSEW
jgi:hypothetical protein